MEKKLPTYLRLLSFKMMQIIVQSRLGCKIHTTAQPESSKYCFHITIDDIPEVAVETRRALNNRQINGKNWLSIEISLKTVSGESMTVEIWSLEMHNEKAQQDQQQDMQQQQQQQQAEDSICGSIGGGGGSGGSGGGDSTDDRDSFSLYNRMSGMLKALLSITRTTPAYKLSRGQAPDSYVMCYRICYGRPNLELLGNDCESMQVGRIKTTLGEIVLRATYRTRMTIDSPRDQHNVAADPIDNRGKAKSSSSGNCAANKDLSARRNANSENRNPEMYKKEFWQNLSRYELYEIVDKMKPGKPGAFAAGSHFDDYDWETFLPGFEGFPFPIGTETATMIETQPDGTKTEIKQTFRIFPKPTFIAPDIDMSWMKKSVLTPRNRNATERGAATDADFGKASRKPKSVKTPKPQKPTKSRHSKLYSMLREIKCPFAEPRNPRNLIDYFLEVRRTKALKWPVQPLESVVPLGTERERNERRRQQMRQLQRRYGLDAAAAEAALPPPVQSMSSFLKECEKEAALAAEMTRKFEEMKTSESSGGGCGGGDGGGEGAGPIDLLLD